MCTLVIKVFLTLSFGVRGTGEPALDSDVTRPGPIVWTPDPQAPYCVYMSSPAGSVSTPSMASGTTGDRKRTPSDQVEGYSLHDKFTRNPNTQSAATVRSAVRGTSCSTVRS